ncbi:MAG: hypothetical protein EBT03_07280 [Betaproteobacteria bacterium]|nr:hypothetical protein [Betaproteobacteria bacterium]
MPAKKNIKKSAAALFQNAKAIEKAMAEGATFGAVIRRLGNGAFSIQLDEKGKEKVQGTPRGLFTSGTMRIHVGQLVIVEGASATRPWEIVALIDEKSTADALVKRGRLSAKLVGVANAAGAVEEAEAPKEDIFLPAEGEDFWTQGIADVRGGLKAERKAQEEAATISARVATLKGSKTAKKGVDGGVAVGSLADPLLFSGEEERFKRWRAHKAKMAAAAPAPSGGALVPAPLTEEDLMVQFREERDAARLAAELAAAAAAEAERVRAEAARASLAAMPVKENWDDVDLDDL